MGFALSWLAVKGKPVADILRELRLRPTGTQGLEGEESFASAQSDAGWYLIVMNVAEHEYLGPNVIGPLSAGCEVMTCTVEEHVMFSESAGWKDGRQLWRVRHEGENGPVGLEEEGTFPAEYAPIRERLAKQQESEGGATADVDYLFDIPVVLAQTFVGYKHDEINSAFATDGFEVLEFEDPTPAKRSWLGRLIDKTRDN
jgi:hypothetical protein